MALHFTKEEFSSRKSKVVAELKKQNLDALLMFKQESMYWLTGYDTFGYVFFQSLILTSKGDIVLLTRAPDLRQAQNTSIIKDIRIWIDNEESKPSDELKNILSELNLEKSNLGVEYDSYGLTGKNAIDLNNSLKNFLTLHDKSQLVSKLRLVKSSEEIKYVKKASELTDKALDEVWKNAKTGISEGKILAEMQKVIFEGGGDFSIDVFSKKLAPYDYFVGLLAPEPHRYGSYYTDENTVFDVVSVDAQGEIAGNRELEVKVFEIEWRWWWSRGRDNLSRYENTNTYRPIKDFTVSTGANGKGQFTLNIPEQQGGRYLIRVIDKASGHATGKTVYFYRNWWKRPSGANAESSKMLVFSADKENYKVGEDAVITFPSGSKGRAFISIENGTEVLSKQWVETQKGETQVSIPLTKEMAPNVYVNISLLQPHAQTKNDLPIRLYGVIPLMVENPKTKLHPEISMPEVLKPEENYTVKVNEAQGREMTYTLAVVDEGLLDLTRYTTPDIHGAFYAREALGVKTFDIFDDVIGAYSGSVDNIYEIGGGDAAAGAKNRKADRFKPVVTFLGPFHLKAGESKTHHLFMPNYVGSVKTMVVAGDNSTSAYGNAEKVTPVRKPLMVLASLPRKLSPGEKVTLPVTVFAMEKQVKNVKVEVKADEAEAKVEAAKKSQVKAKGITTDEIKTNTAGNPLPENIIHPKGEENLEFEEADANTFTLEFTPDMEDAIKNGVLSRLKSEYNVTTMEEYRAASEGDLDWVCKWLI